MASLLLAAPPKASQSFILTAPPTASQSFILTPSVFFSKSQSLINTPSLLSTSATSLSTSHSAAALPFIHCGRGDKKTARGKRFKHSFGNARPKDKKKGRGPPRVPAPPLPPRKDKYDDGEVVRIEIDESLFSN